MRRLYPLDVKVRIIPKRTAIGALPGAAGAIIGGGGKASVIGALIGAAVGGGAGYAIGHHMDKQAKEIKEAVPDAQVERVGEGINMTFNSGLLFKINSSILSDDAKVSLQKVAGVFVKYPETNILIEGHTDSVGTDQLNMTLSENRASSVRDFLIQQGMATTSIASRGFGKTQPKYPNDVESQGAESKGEVGVMANDQMKEKAKEGKLEQ